MNGHENLPTDFEIFSTETEIFTTDIEILLARFKYDRYFVGKTQQKWNFLFKIQQKVKIREQDPTDIENCFTRLIQDSTETKFCFQDSKWPKFSDSRLDFRHWTSHGHPVHVTQTRFFCSLLLNWKHVNEELSTTPRGRRIVYFSEAHNFGTHLLSKLKLLLDNLHYLDYLAHTSIVVFRPWKGHFGQSERSIYTGTQFWEVTTSCSDLPTLDTHCGPF